MPQMRAQCTTVLHHQKCSTSGRLPPIVADDTVLVRIVAATINGGELIVRSDNEPKRVRRLGASRARHRHRKLFFWGARTAVVSAAA